MRKAVIKQLQSDLVLSRIVFMYKTSALQNSLALLKHTRIICSYCKWNRTTKPNQRSGKRERVDKVTRRSLSIVQAVLIAFVYMYILYKVYGCIEVPCCQKMILRSKLSSKKKKSTSKQKKNLILTLQIKGNNNTWKIKKKL